YPMRVIVSLALTGLALWALALGCDSSGTTPAALEPTDPSGALVETAGAVPGTSITTLAGRGFFEEGERSPWTSSPAVTGSYGDVYRLYAVSPGPQQITMRTTGDGLTRSKVVGNASVVRPFPNAPVALQLGNYSTYGAPLNMEAQDVTWALSVTKADDAWESNDSPLTAKPLAVSGFWKTGAKIGLGNGTTAPDSSDYFKYTLAAGTTYKINISWAGAAEYNVTGARIDIVVQNDRGAVVAQAYDNAIDEANALTYRPTTAGNYTVGFKVRSANYNADGGKGICFIPYSFRVMKG
ncbi:MAG TPA: hypothetical protein VEI97_10960, partial [bacterium]|nr:hypothetical protein [bacterium]